MTAIQFATTFLILLSFTSIHTFGEKWEPAEDPARFHVTFSNLAPLPVSHSEAPAPEDYWTSENSSEFECFDGRWRLCESPCVRLEEPGEVRMKTKVNYIPEGYPNLIPYLILKEASKAIQFYKDVFGAVEVLNFPAPGGKVGHAELRIGNSFIMLADEFPDMGYRSPKSLGGTPVSLMVYVENVDAIADRVVSAGAKVLRPVKDQFYGDRSGTFEDPWGHVWTISTHTEDLTPEEIEKRAKAAGHSD